MFEYRQGHFKDTKNWRLSLVQANYITWSLSAGQRTNLTRHRRHVRPSTDDLQLAKTNLLKMDYLLDLSYPDKLCRERTMQYLNLDEGVSERDGGKPKAHATNNLKKCFKVVADCNEKQK